MKKLQDEQFKTEIKNLEAMQQSAYDQIRFHRSVWMGAREAWTLRVAIDKENVEGLVRKFKA
jgi:hypothetical protein